jgi:DNA repair exonuclease SbcCD ATPase subunit
MIDLHKLWLDGWMSYDTAEIILDAPGITRIRGPIGAGKSAIIEAIFYLLFGTTLRKTGSKILVGDLINKVLKHGYDIRLKLAVDGIPYTIREIRDRPNHGLYFSSNKKDLRGKTDPDTRKIILKKLGISAEDFRAIAVLGQRQAQQLITGKPSERAAVLVEIFGLAKYNEIIEACNADVKDAVKAKKRLTQQLQEYKEELNNLECKLLDIAETEESTGESATLAANLTRIEDQIAKTANKLLQIQRLAQDINKLIGKYDAIDEQKMRLQKVTKELRKLKEGLKRYKKPTRTKHEISIEIEKLNDKRSGIASKLTIAKQAIADAKNMKNICPVNEKNCPVNVPTEFKTAIINKNTETKDSLIEARIAVNTKYAKLEKEQENLEDYTDLHAQIHTKQNIIADLKIPDRPRDLKKQKAKLKKCQIGVAQGTEKLNKLQKERTRVQAGIAVAAERESMEKRVAEALADKEEAIENLQNLVNKKSIEAQYLAGALAVFKKMKMYKIDLVLQLLNTNIKSILDAISNKVYQAEFVSQRKSADQKKTLDKVGITVYDSHKSIPIEMCSGGQSTKVGLAVLLSTWKAANAISQKGVSSLWLDEVFGPLDEEIINRVFDAVINIANEIGTTSVKIISHRDLDSRLFDHFWDVDIIDGISNISIT